MSISPLRPRLPAQQREDPPFSDLEKIFASLRDLRFGVGDALIVHVNRSGLDEALCFGVGRGEVQGSQQPRKPHGASGEGNSLRFHIFRVLAHTEYAIELFARGFGGRPTVIACNNTFCEFRFDVPWSASAKILE